MKVCVIGSGIFGIAAVREIGDRHPDAAVRWISADGEAGGLWNAASHGSRVYDSLHLNTSTRRSGFTGLPIAADPSVHFVHHSHYAAYLADVAATCTGVDRQWGSRVVAVRARAGGWLVRWQTGDDQAEDVFDAVVDATGHHGAPMSPDVPVADDLWYEYSHSATYRNAEPYRGRSVLVVGNGASAVDIACELAAVAARVSVSVRRPKWHLPKTLFGKPVDQSGEDWWQHAPVLRHLASGIGERVVRTVVGDYTGYGLGEPDAPLALSTPVLSDQFLPLLSHGRLHVYDRVAALEEAGVRFGDGTVDKFDAVIAATGFRDSSPHLPEPVQRAISGGRLGLALEAPGHPRLYLLNRFRCGDAAVRCAQEQAAAVVRSLRAGRAVALSPTARSAAPGARITARVLRRTYEVYR